MSGLSTVIEGTQLLAADKRVLSFKLVGSACYMPEPKDIDFLVLVDWTPDDFLADGTFGAEVRWWWPGFDLCEGEYDDKGDQWLAVRKGDINLIVTHDKGWYERASLANSVCHLLKLENKVDRVAVYRLVRDGQGVEQARATAIESMRGKDGA